MIDDALREKLRKLQNLAAESPNEHECQAALLAFQKLLKKNDMTVADVALDEADVETVETDDVYVGKRFEKWLVALHGVIGKHFRCLSLVSKNRITRWKTLQFLGHSDDVTIAASAFESAYSAALRLYNEHRLDNPHRTVNRCQYLTGFVFGLKRAYMEQEASGELGLMIVIPPDVQEAANGYKRAPAKLDRLYSRDESAGFSDGMTFGKGNALPA